MIKYEKTIDFIAKSISEKYSLGYEEAIKIVYDSFLIDLLKENFNYVTHYDADYWAEEIMNDTVMV